MWQADVLTLYPQAFPAALGVGVLQRAQKQQLWQLNVHTMRDFGLPPHQSVDDTPAGGGAGMVLRADVALRALRSVSWHNKVLLYPSARGTPFNSAMAKQWAQLSGAVILCGRFEGVDERIFQLAPVHEVCVGDAVLCGGEVAAMLMLEATVRLLPQVLGNPLSVMDESFSQPQLEYPQYTQPAIVEHLAIPTILQSGHHAHIKAARQQAAKCITKRRRPDLLKL